MKSLKHVGRFWMLLGLMVVGFAADTAVAQQLSLPLPGITKPGPSLSAAQMKVNTLLPSVRYQLQVDPQQIARYLEPLDAAQVHLQKPNQIGVGRPVEISPASHGARVVTADGNTVIVLSVVSPGAAALRVHFANFDLGPEDYVYVRGASGEGSVAGPYSGRGPWGDGDFWSSTIEGDTVVIEYQSRRATDAFSVPEVSHLFATPDTLSCEVDASCSTGAEKNAVGRILFVEGSSSYVCSGTLLNDRNQDFTPYFLTANHCVSTQTVAQTVEAYWLYQTTSCNSGVLRSDIKHTTSGSDLLASDASRDFALVKMRDSAPAGTNFSGWDPAQVALNTAVWGYHHPDGYSPPSLQSFLRRASGTLVSTGNSCSSTGLANGYRINWSSGTTEAGSSGSGLWYGQSYLIGVLSCGSDTGQCTGSYDFYSKFSDIYPSIRNFIDPVTVGNNNFASAQNLVGAAGTVSGSNVGATKEAGEPNHAGNSGGVSVWYSWTAPIGGPVVVDTLQSNFDTLLAIYTGSNVNGLTAIASNDDASTSVRQSSVTFRAIAGVTYRIAVDGYAGATGNIKLRWRAADVPRDFNFDIKPDLIWQNNSTGQRTVWFMDNTAYFSERGLPTVSTQWQIATTGDFNSDGQADIVWQNVATGQRTIWFMNGATWVAEQALPTVSTQWSIAGANDFNGDGQIDILWQNTATGQHSIWFMSGASWVGERALPTVATDWEIVGTGDFNHDGHPDILWQNKATGQRTIWLMNGPNWVAERYIGSVPAQWSIAGAADFNQDGQVDIVWQNLQTGQRSIWLMNNGTWAGQEAPLPSIAPSWEIRIH